MKKFLVFILLFSMISVEVNAEIIVPKDPIIFERGVMYKPFEQASLGGQTHYFGSVYNVGAIYSSPLYETYVVSVKNNLFLLSIHVTNGRDKVIDMNEHIKDIYLFDYWKNEKFYPNSDLTNRAALGFPKMRCKTLDIKIEKDKTHRFLVAFELPKEVDYNSLFLMIETNTDTSSIKNKFQLPKPDSISELMD